MRKIPGLVTIFFLLLHGTPLLAASEEAVERNSAGAKLLQQGKIVEAIAEFQKAIRLDPKYAPARANIAYAYDRQERMEEAVTEYQKAAELEPKNPIVHNNLGVLYSKQGLYEEAISAFETALRFDSNNSSTLKNLDIAKKNRTVMQKKEEEIVKIHKEVEAQPTNPTVLYKLARLYAFHGKKDEAMEWLEKALKLGFNDLELLKRDPALEALRDSESFTRLLTAP